MKIILGVAFYIASFWMGVVTYLDGPDWLKGVILTYFAYQISMAFFKWEGKRQDEKQAEEIAAKRAQNALDDQRSAAYWASQNKQNDAG